MTKDTPISKGGRYIVDADGTPERVEHTKPAPGRLSPKPETQPETKPDGGSKKPSSKKPVKGGDDA